VSEVHANGVRLYYEEHGSGDPILCIHGISSSAMVWRDTAVEALSRLGSVIIYDRRGSTRSERPEPYETSVAQHAEDAAALLGALDAVPAVVIGRSYGGDTAIELALRHAERVRALVLLEAAEVLDAEAKAWAEEVRDAIEEAAAREPHSAAEVLFRQIGAADTWESFSEPVRQMFIDNSPAILAELRGPWLDVTSDDLSRIDVPTLYVAAMESPPAYRRVTDRIAEAIPGSRIVFVEGGHLIDPGHPEVLRFVDEVLGSG
jgi:pimeloyl-ACP methyl ester carboxylesterase